MMRTVIVAWSLVMAATAGAQEADKSTVGLNQYSSWRMFSELKPPEIALEGGVKIVQYKDENNFWLNGETASPAAGWMKPEFDDTEWLRGPVGMECRAPVVERAYYRGKFLVTDASQVKTLTLAVGYHGGAVVYLNGEEVGRKNIAAGERLADAYPAETFVRPDGSIMVSEGRWEAVPGGKTYRIAGKPTAADLTRAAPRERKLEVEPPTKLLRKGVNVLAIELVRSPYHKVVEEQKTQSWNGEPGYYMDWNTCELETVKLTASGGVANANVGRTGLQPWNSSLLGTDFVLDRKDPCEPLRPIEMTGAHNGIYSGKVLLGSDKAIRGLRAVASELRRTDGAVIPVSAIRVRYAVPGGAEYGVEQSTYGVTAGKQLEGSRWATGKAEALSVLMDEPLKEYGVAQVSGEGGGEGQRGFGAVASIWVTVKVPAEARAGSYTGKVSISAEGEQTIEVPVSLKVFDWKMPDPDNFQTWTEIIESPDTLQLEYGVPAWSDKHFELIGRSFRLMREVGSKVVYVPLICCTYYGNEESMVRWVKKGENDYDFDFTVMDRYLDAAEKNLGKPEIVCFIVWDVFMSRSSELSVGGSHEQTPEILARLKERMWNPCVTTVEAETGKVGRVEFPDYFKDGENKKQWKKLFDALHARLKKRGLEGTMMLGWFSDVRAQKGEFEYWKEVTGELPWVSHAHWTVKRVAGDYIKTGYNTSIHDVNRPVDPAKGRRYGWKKEPVLWAQNLLRPGFRGEMDMLPGSIWFNQNEITLAGGQRGFGRLGGDSWFVLKDKAGRRVGRVYDRYPWSEWPNLNLCCSLFAPGPDGAVATAHFEQMREGIQECEARIFIEQALTDDAKRAKLGADLAGRCQALLDERVLYDLRGVASYDSTGPWAWWFQNGVAGHAWNQSSGWQSRSQKLYELAGEVAGKLGEK